MSQSSSFGQQPVPHPWQLPTPGQLYPIPELTLTENKGGILVVAPPEKAQWAVQVLQLGTVFTPDPESYPEVVTGSAHAVQPGTFPNLRDWVDAFVLENKVVLVFLHTVVKGPIRFVVTSSPLLVAALAQPTHTDRNYAVLDGPGYLIEKARELVAKGGGGSAVCAAADQVHDTTVAKAVAEGTYTAAPDPSSDERLKWPQVAVFAAAFLAGYFGVRVLA